VSARSLDFVDEGEGQCAERQDAASTIPRGASDLPNRRIDLETAGLRCLAGDVPCSKLNRVEFEFLFRSRANSFSTMRALVERLNPVPSAPISIVSPC